MSRLRQLYEKGAPAWSGLVATLNDPDLIAVVFFCLIIFVVSAGWSRWNEWYLATHPYGVERPGQVVDGSRERAELQALSDAWPHRHSAHTPKRQ